MSLYQILKTIVKVITILPVVLEGIKSIVKRYKELNDQNGL